MGILTQQLVENVMMTYPELKLCDVIMATYYIGKNIADFMVETLPLDENLKLMFTGNIGNILEGYLELHPALINDPRLFRKIAVVVKKIFMEV